MFWAARCAKVPAQLNSSPAGRARAGRGWGCVGAGGALTPPPALGCTPSPAFVYRLPPQLQRLPQLHSASLLLTQRPEGAVPVLAEAPQGPHGGGAGGWAEESRCQSSGHRLALQPPATHPECRLQGGCARGAAPRPSTGCPSPLPELPACSGNGAVRPGPGRARGSGIPRGRQ